MVILTAIVSVIVFVINILKYSWSFYTAFFMSLPHITLLWVNIILLAVQSMFPKPKTIRSVVTIKLWLNGIALWAFLAYSIVAGLIASSIGNIVITCIMLIASVVAIIIELGEFRDLPPKEEPQPPTPMNNGGNFGNGGNGGFGNGAPRQPYNGQPMPAPTPAPVPRFDPQTGKPLNQGDTPTSEE